MTIDEAMTRARMYLSKNDAPKTLTGYKDLGEHYGFFVSVANSNKAEVGSAMLLVSKRNGIVTWRSIRRIGPRFINSETKRIN